MEAGSESRSSNIKRRLQDGFHIYLDHFWKTQEYNQKTFRQQPLQEISGAFGDLGTLLPILVALVNRYSDPAIDLSSTLVFTGIFNIFNGAIFGLPLPVQPMKAIAAIALSNGLDKKGVATAGLVVAVVIGFLSVTRLLEWFNRNIPVPVIKGIQVGVGLSLVVYGGGIFMRQDEGSPPDLPGLLRVIAFLGFLASTAFRQIPVALMLLLLGVLVALPSLIRHPTALGIWHPHPFVPQMSWFYNPGIDAGLGQTPLTVLNSIIAVSALSADLLPNVPTPTPTAIGLSVTGMNLIGCWFGSMPVCHGSGGLAAQYRFGARSGASVIFLGLIKLLLGLLAGRFAGQLFKRIPNAILGIMLIAAGLELASVGESLNMAEARDLSESKDGVDTLTRTLHEKLTLERRRRRWTTMLVTVGGTLAFKTASAGFGGGMLCHWSYQSRDWYVSRRARREGTIRLDDEDDDDGNRPRAVVS